MAKEPIKQEEQEEPQTGFQKLLLSMMYRR